MNAARRIAVVFVLIVGLAASFLFNSCHSKSTQPGAEKNLLTNGSFEINGQPTLTGWTPADSDLAKIVAAPAPQGGFYSLQLTADWAPTHGFVRTSIPDAKDGDIVRLSAFVRAVDSEGGGSISVNVGDPERITAEHNKGVYTLNTDWTYLTVIDTLHMQPGDSAWIRLSSPATEIVPRVGQFDRVTLVRLNE